MEGFLKVSPESLKSAAGEFGGQARSLQGLTSQMLDLIRSLSAAWNGDASRAYLTKFDSLETDMGKMYNMVMEHSTDLQNMADAYAKAEDANVQAAQPLQTNILV